MTDRFWNDPRTLNAGDVRRLGTDNISPVDARPASPVSMGNATGDLDESAARLGVDVADLVRIRRRLGVAASHRRPSLFARLFGRKGRP